MREDRPEAGISLAEVSRQSGLVSEPTRAHCLAPESCRSRAGVTAGPASRRGDRMLGEHCRYALEGPLRVRERAEAELASGAWRLVSQRYGRAFDCVRSRSGTPARPPVEDVMIVSTPRRSPKDARFRSPTRVSTIWR
jgi:hypothetical protein